jgi:hypothetical protein
MLQWVADVGFMSRVGSNLKYVIVGHGVDTIRFVHPQRKPSTSPSRDEFILFCSGR